MNVTTSLFRESILPIIKVTTSCQFPFQPAVLSQIVFYVEIAQKNGGRLMENEINSPLRKDEKTSATIQLIFPNEPCLQRFVKEIKPKNN